MKRLQTTVQWLKTAKDIWDELEERYRQTTCAQLFSIQEKISKAVQSSNESVESFFTKMKGLWNELDNLDPQPVCVCSGCSGKVNKKMIKIQQGRKLMEFLMKMNPKYRHIRSNILMIKEPPSAAEADKILMREQTHQELSKSTHVEEQETPIACRIENKRKYGEKGKFVQSKKASYYCEH